MFQISEDGIKFVGGNVISILDLIISALLIAFTIFILAKIVKRVKVFVACCISFTLMLLAWLFSLQLLWGISTVLTILVVVTALFVNQAEIRPLFANTLASKLSHHANVDKMFDRHALYEKITLAVENLSKNKTGAIISFERDVKLDDYIKSGTIINAPVTPELLITIFYPGTRLHDGAVVIRRDQILAASVYYTPTTKPLTGKYGSRHRASIGISEVTDAITVVVSEETGRVSITSAGELIPVTLDTFARTLEECMMNHKVEEA